MPAQDIVIGPPVRGRWAIYNPPGHPVLAFDFLAEDENKSLYRKGSFLKHLFTFITVEDTITWASPLYSPVDGVVVACHDSEADRLKISFLYDLFSLMINKPKESAGFGAFGGNYIMIGKDDYYVLLCHLRQGSAKVKPGDTVKAGQEVGAAGNSGSSIQPHLHIQVMKNERYFPLFGNLLPFRISSGNVLQDGRWQQRENIRLESKAHYLFE